MKKFLITAVTLIFMNASAYAQVVTVQGSGISESAAITNAKRVAVEQVIGTRIFRYRSVSFGRVRYKLRSLKENIKWRISRNNCTGKCF